VNRSANTLASLPAFNRRLVRMLWLTLLSVVASSCASQAGTTAATPAPTTPTSGGVFVVGGIHQAHEGAKKYTYERMGEVFRRLSPEVLCVEVLQERLDDGTNKGMPFDFLKFMVPAARELSVPIKGIDWWDESRGDQWQRLQQEAGEDPALGVQIRLIGGLFGLLGEYYQEADFREINSPAATQLQAAKNAIKYEVLADLPKYRPIADYENERNRHMFENVMVVVRQFPGRRILVAVGIDHKWYLERALREDGVRVLTVDDATREWWR
jgi:hypothetical protein